MERAHGRAYIKIHFLPTSLRSNSSPDANTSGDSAPRLQLAMSTWRRVELGQENPLVDLICRESVFLRYLSADKLRALMDASQYIGDTPDRARQLSEIIHGTVS